MKNKVVVYLASGKTIESQDGEVYRDEDDLVVEGSVQTATINWDHVVYYTEEDVD